MFLALLALSLSEEVKDKKEENVEELIEHSEAAASLELQKIKESIEALERLASNSEPPNYRPARQTGQNNFNRNQYQYYPVVGTHPVNHIPSEAPISSFSYFPTSTPSNVVPTRQYFPNQNFVPQNDAAFAPTFKPSTFTYVPPQNNYYPVPPQNNYSPIPPQNNYKPVTPQNNYKPPKNTYNPVTPQNNYRPPLNDYKPVVPQNNNNPPKNPVIPQNDYYHPSNTWTTTTPSPIITNEIHNDEYRSYKYE